MKDSEIFETLQIFIAFSDFCTDLFSSELYNILFSDLPFDTLGIPNI